MKNITYILSIFLFASLASCEMKDELKGKYEEPGTEGKLNLQLESGQVPEVSLTAGTKAAAPVNPADFAVEIYNEQKVLVKQFKRFADMQAAGLTLALPKGNYTVKAFSCELEEAGWERPYFVGEEPFIIEPNMITKVKLSCEMKNVKVTLEYTDEFLKTFKDDYSAVVTNGKGILTYNKSEARAGYFKVGDFLKMTINATTITDDREVTQTIDLKNADGGVAPKDYFRVLLDIKPQVGTGGKPVIIVDITTIDREVEIQVPTEPDGGGGEEEPAGAPALVGDGFDIDAPFTFAQGEEPQVKVNITAEKGIEELVVRIESPFLTEEVLGAFGIPVSFDMAHLTPTLETNFKAIGLLGDEPILGTKALLFDISTFMGLLEPGEHKFHLTVKDAAGVSTTKILTIVMTE